MFQERHYGTVESDGGPTEAERRRALLHLIYSCLKTAVLLIVWFFFTVLLIIRKPHELEKFPVSVEPNKQYVSPITEWQRDILELELQGRIKVDMHERPSNIKEKSSYISVWLQQIDMNSNETLWKGNEWKVYLLETETKAMTSVKHIFRVPEKDSSRIVLQLAMTTTSKDIETVLVVLDTSPIDKDCGVIYSFVLITFLYILVIWDLTDRTFAALLTTTAAVGVLTLMNARPTLHTILSWIDVGTLMLLFGMMIMVAILSETGIFDYVAVMAYKYSRGHAWLLMFLLCQISGYLSALLDNVTMVLLMVPLTIRLCEIMSLRPNIILITIAIFTNIGGTMTPVGDPPNVIIATNSFVTQQGIDFINFTIHMAPGVIVCMILTFGLVYLMLRRRIYMVVDDPEMEDVKIREKLDDSIDSEVSERIVELTKRYRSKMDGTRYLKPAPQFIETLAELQVRYKIRNIPLLIKCGIALGFAILLFFLHSLPSFAGVKLPWAAILAALLLLILANLNDLQIILLRVEWSTLFFFAALFILMEITAKLGLIEWIGDKTVKIILSVGEKYQLAVAITLLLWISALTSAFVDNIPITTMMLKLAIEMKNNKSINLPFAPLIWALAFGACLGGNGTMIGASANVVTVGLSNQHGYKITFMDFFSIGFPVSLMTVLVVWIYLLIAHLVFEWH